MGQQVGVSKAASSLGISRHELQRLIHDGDLHTFEGQVDLDELRQRYPTMALKDDLVKERIDLIRNTSFSRRVTSTVMPDTDTLENQLRRRTTELNVAEEKMKHFRGCIQELAQVLGDLNRDASPEQKRVLAVINSWLLDRLEH
jgi:CDP-4-dehydro-6-deoxyglucose reductase, E3